MTSFADLHVPGHPLVLVNAWDVLSALALADAGHPAIGTTSLGITAAAGLLDGVREGRGYTVSLVHALAGRLTAHLTVDLEDGYDDDPSAVAELVAELAGAGVAGINLEDAHRSGIDQAAMISVVRASQPGLFINARTDVFWSGSHDRREAVDRLRLYRDAGADGLFVPGMVDHADLAPVIALGLPVNTLWEPGVDFAAMGVARISTGSAIYRQAVAAALLAASAARDQLNPPLTAMPYSDTQRLLTRHLRPSARTRSSSEPAQ